MSRRLSRLGGSGKTGRQLVAFNLGIDRNIAELTNKDILYDDVTNDKYKMKSEDIGLVKDRIKKHPLWGGIELDVQIILLRDVFGIDAKSEVGEFILSGSNDTIRNVKEHLDILKEDIGNSDAVKKVEKITAWRDNSLDKMKEKFEPKRYKEFKEVIEEQKDELLERIDEVTDDVLGKVEELATDQFGVELQCL